MPIRVFKDPKKYEELVIMLNNPVFSYVFISKHFSCDHKSIMYHARKIGINTGDRLYIRMPPEPKEPKIYKDPRHISLLVEKVNEGKSYAEYIAETRERNTKRIVIGNFVF